MSPYYSAVYFTLHSPFRSTNSTTVFTAFKIPSQQSQFLSNEAAIITTFTPAFYFPNATTVLSTVAATFAEAFATTYI